MKIYVKKNGRLGNNLFQYFFGKILASELNCELITEFELPSEFGLKNFYKNKVSLEKVVLLREKYNVYNPKDSMRFKLMLNEVEILKDLNTIISEIKKLDNNITLVLDGFFQIFSYYENYEDIIKNSFLLTEKIEKNTLGVHIRKDDIKNTDFELPDIWYINMVEKFPNHKIYITTDSPNDPLIKFLLNKGCQLYTDTPQKTILKFSTFSDLLLSGGSFSWWMGFLSKGKKYVLIPEKGWYTENSDAKPYPKKQDWELYKMLSNQIINF
jgi:hypothetical protein